jgi:hypothetical protein
LAYGTASQEEEVDKLADRSGHARKGNMREQGSPNDKTTKVLRLPSFREPSSMTKFQVCLLWMRPSAPRSGFGRSLVALFDYIMEDVTRYVGVHHLHTFVIPQTYHL